MKKMERALPLKEVLPPDSDPNSFRLLPDGEKDEVRAWLREHHPDILGWWHDHYAHSAEGATQLIGNWYETESSGADPDTFQPTSIIDNWKHIIRYMVD
ncbi:hypothetical protein HF638_22860 [Paenibacillus sp. SZ31]|uniref:hypothetical protein n=1 Tax=Paenibacillus sp. SZ31 TaxID=2725555 RepID=UPI00146E4964|nr:hypothetical protein [Paenibacillus sp. SZ31]NMI06832.1 hypothetical protein [Paenibacillus sp. SZ31]